MSKDKIEWCPPANTNIEERPPNKFTHRRSSTAPVLQLDESAVAVDLTCCRGGGLPPPVQQCHDWGEDEDDGRQV